MTKAPEDARFMLITGSYRSSGGYFNYKILYFKKEDDLWFVYDSDSDNEYAGWRQLIGNGMKWFINNNLSKKLTDIPSQLRNEND